MIRIFTYTHLLASIMQSGIHYTSQCFSLCLRILRISSSCSQSNISLLAHAVCLVTRLAIAWCFGAYFEQRSCMSFQVDGLPCGLYRSIGPSLYRYECAYESSGGMIYARQKFTTTWHDLKMGRWTSFLLMCSAWKIADPARACELDRIEAFFTLPSYHYFDTITICMRERVHGEGSKG
jgi:hypothetical protein